MAKFRTLCICLPVIVVVIFAANQIHQLKFLSDASSRIRTSYLDDQQPTSYVQVINQSSSIQIEATTKAPKRLKPQPVAQEQLKSSSGPIKIEKTTPKPKMNASSPTTDSVLLSYLEETVIKNVNDFDRWTNTNRSVTVVTAFFDIGKYPRGSKSSRGPDKYKQWIRVFRLIQNPIIFYTDSEEFEKIFIDLRKNVTSNTKVIRLSRDALWSFQIKPKVEKIFANPRYPKHKPYTTVPDYTCTTHSKFPILADAAKRNIYSSKYFAWVDIGYFREIENATNKFWLEVPTEFDKTKIGATRIFNSRHSGSASSIIRLSMNWIGAGIFLGERNIFLTFTEQYKQSVMRFLNKGLISVEQYMLGAMYSKVERIAYPPRVEIQAFQPINGRTKTTDPWFYLGFLMYKEVK
ncbi:LOW QUALITY PROTEIN: protein HtrL-like [Pecten maximus]|uniref:LOW QUALITY PROTEIN: protein HtrL-like n=1 Tax=Pecten maximus TaxID=6579 RepID=UPI001458C945|nr:LOW QUALITY PROTEIN: protein HtrL-like [Pecten maximus]